ncbi:syntaxin [Beauveria brongniartii RCEF 3172]|uniref:Syntaxin n=1 Tax=Beauveria brongniartii RCEF 3172 TaxID=1081107 RepID=A0A166VR96_9HYPO|nr:syntaxin [Beauveria brongniartii RCEF 3172]
MTTLTPDSTPSSNTSNALLDQCGDVNAGIDGIEPSLEQLRILQHRALNDADNFSSSATNQQLDALSSETLVLYCELIKRVCTIKSNPEANDPKYKPQVDRVDRRLKQAIQKYQQVESGFRKRTQDQMARQYRIVRPDASEQEVRAAVEDTSNNQVFSQVLMQSDRQGRARAALSAVQDRHNALVKIEQQIVELSQLFQDMDTLVVQQEDPVTQIEKDSKKVVENIDKGTEEICAAVDTARKTRRRKWICLGIFVAIIVVILIVVLAYVLISRTAREKSTHR